MADTKLNIKLGLESQELTDGLRDTRQEFSRLDDGLKNTNKNMGITAAQYYTVKEAIEGVLDGLRFFKSELAMLGVEMAEHVAHVLEWVEAIGRTGLALAEIPEELNKTRGRLLELTEATEEYVAVLHNDPFLRAAEQAQVYQARLAGLSGSAEAAAKDLEYLYSVGGDKSKSGGFASESIVEAGLALKELKQNMEDTIPTAIKLAAGTGEDLTKAAVTLGNAYEGLNSGFSSLQRTFHITREEIKNAGAALDENNDIASRTTEEYTKTRAAIEKLINTKFGDVVGRNAKTIKGAFQSVENAIHGLMEQIGELYGESVADFVSGIASMIEKSKQFIPILKFLTENLYNFMTPIGLAAKYTVELGNKTMDAFAKIKKGYEEMSPTLQLFVGSLAMAIPVATKVTVALSGMMAASLIFAGVFKGLSMLTGGLLKVVPASGLAAKGLEAVGKMASASAGFCMKMLRTVMMFPVATLVIAAMAAAFIMVRNENKKAEEANRAYKEQLDRTAEAGRQGNEVIGKTAEQMIKSGQTSAQLSQSLEGLRAAYEKVRLEASEARQAFENSEHWDPAKDLEEVKLKEAIAAHKKAILDETVKNVRKAIEERRAIELRDGTAGEALYKRSEELENRNLQFQKDKAKGLIQTKQEESVQMKAIYDEALKDRENLEKDIAVLEARSASENHTNGATEERLRRFKAMYEKMLGLENEYRLPILSIQREAVQEQFQLQQEAIDQDISLGKAGNKEKIKLLQEFLANNAEQLKYNVALRTQIERQIVTLAFQTARELKAARMQTRQEERRALDDKMSDLQYEDSIGKNRVKNLEAENKIIHTQTQAQIKDIQEKRDMDMEAQGDAELRAQIEKQAAAQIAGLRHQEMVQIRENQQSHAEMTAQEIQDNIQRINSQKALLQSKLSLLENEQERGFDFSEEIRANKAAQLQKEIDTIKSEEKSRLATEKDVRKIETIKLESENRITEAKNQYALEAANFEEQLQIRLIDRKKKLNEVLMAENEARAEEFQERVRHATEAGKDVFEEEQKYIKENLNLRLAAIQLERDAELSRRQAPEEAAEIRRKYAAEERKARLDAAKQEEVAIASEMKAKADAHVADVADQNEIKRLKIEQGLLGKNRAIEDRQLVLDELDATKKQIQAEGELAVKQADAKDKARVQHEYHLKMNKAIRDGIQNLKDINAAYATGNTALDKIVAKYDKALADLQRMQGILDGWDDEPAPTPPTEEEMRNDPMAKSRWEDEVKKQKKKVEDLKKKKQQEEEKEARKRQAEAEQQAEADRVKKRTEELRAEGKSGAEIRAILAEESTARRKASNEAKKNHQPDPYALPSAPTNASEVPGYTPGQGLPKDPGIGPRDAKGNPIKGPAGAPPPGSSSGGGNEDTAYLKRIADGIDKLVGSKTSAQTAGDKPKKHGPEHSKKLNGGDVSSFSFGEVAGMTPYGFPSYG